MSFKPKLLIERFGALLAFFVCLHFSVFADDKDFPPRPDPPQLVNDLAHILSASEVQQLELKLEDYARTTSTQVAIVTITDLGDYDVADYTNKLINKWGVGQKDKQNGVMILFGVKNHRVAISTGGGVQGDLTDVLCARIIRNEMVPAFKLGNYYEGFSKSADAVIAATKGEYKADDKGATKHVPFKVIAVIIIMLVYIVMWIMSKIGGGGTGGGSYMSGRGIGAFGAGWFLGGGGFGGGGFGGGGDSGGGGFGGFGGGGSDGGGASGGW